jgi:branched-subunit amino acid ABC-type transport system permease component
VSLAVQIVLSGLAAGSAYGLLAVGYALVYRLTGIVHLALGDLAALGVFLTLLVTAGTGPVTAATASSWRFLLGLAVALAATAAIGWGSYFGLVHPFLIRGSTVGWVAATAAIAFAIESVLAVVFTRPAYVFPDPLPFDRLGDGGLVTIGGAVVQARSFFVIGLGAALALAVSYGVRRTRFGRGLQAIAADVEGARVVGVPVERWVGGAFGLVGALAAVIAVAAAPGAPFSVVSGATLGLKGLVAALAVGFASPGLAFAAGLGLGVLEAALANGRPFGPPYAAVVPLAFALLVLALRGREAQPE